MPRRVVLWVMMAAAGSAAGQWSTGMQVADVLPRADTTAVDTAQITVAAQLTELLFRRPEGIQWTERLGHLSTELMRSKDPAVVRHATVGMVKMLVYDGTRKLHRGDLTGSLAAYTEGLRLAEGVHDTMSLAVLHNDMGMLYEDAEDMPSAMASYRHSIHLARTIGNRGLAGHTTELLADVHLQREQPDSALMLLRSIDAGTDSVLWWYVMHQQASTLLRMGDTTASRSLHARAGALAERTGGDMLRPLSFSTQTRARFHMRLHEDSLAIVFAMRCVEQARSGRLLAQQCSCHNLLARMYARRGDLNSAEREWTEALALAKKLGLLQDTHRESPSIIGISAQLSDLYARQGRYREATAMAELNRTMRDSADRVSDKRAVDLYRFREELAADSLSNVIASERARSAHQQEMAQEKVRRNVFVAASLGLLLFGTVVWRQRNRIGKEKQRSEELLLNILPQEVAEELKTKGEAEAVQIDQVTVLFTDFKGFTAMSEQVTPRQLVHDLHECFSAFDHICDQHGIEKIKTIGDAYMAAGGLPTPNTTHATDVIRAALAMRDFIAEGKDLKVAAGLPYFEVRIGVHTGPVVAGIVGVKKFQYDIWGDTVNTASRMESGGEEGRVNISEATYALLRNAASAFIFTPRGKVQAKGKGELEMYFVERSAFP